MKEQILKQVALFASLPPDELKHLAEILHYREFSPGTVFIHESEIADHFFILIEGEIEVIKALGTTNERALGVDEAGSFIGEMGLINPGSRRTASVRARTSARLLEMTRANFEALLHRQPELAYKIVRVLSLRLEQHQNRTISDLQAKNLQLTQAYEQLRAAQADLIEKEKMERELEVAREIQMGMLPHEFAGVEQAYGVSFGAVLEPAREVGGDLFGVCAAGPDRLVVFLGDVSGKGIPASMFMVRAISLARLLARDIAEPERILARLNDELAADNPSGMFVTFLCAVFEPKSHRLTLANAGHCRPVLLPAGESPRWAVKNLGTALGFEPGLEFERTQLMLRDGDALILYSDGVSEAFNPQEECYGNERLLTEAGGLAGQSAMAVTTSLLQNVRAFAGSAPQSDDIAILALKVNGKEART
jgi:sigma-B regulation protein RsbU (phosphoserine phosphatase)